MSSIASTIFKIRAHSDFIASANASPDILSFRQGQPFYALSADFKNGFYFVSTQYAVPFSRRAVSGLVPIEYFDKVDLLSKDPPIHRKKVAAASLSHSAAKAKGAAIKMGDTKPKTTRNHQSTVTPVAIPGRKQSLNTAVDQIAETSSSISSIKVMSISNASQAGSESYCFKITRKTSIDPHSSVHIINRTITDFAALATASAKIFPRINAENYPLCMPSRDAKLQALEVYLTRLILVLIPSIRMSVDDQATQELMHAAARFFNPYMDQLEAQDNKVVVRRDSGADTDAVDESQMKRQPHAGNATNPFTSFSKMVFGV